jgi:hypothetical protein
MPRASTLRWLGLRLVGVLAYGGIAPIYLHAESVAARVYNAACAMEGMTYPWETSPLQECVAVMILTLPIVLARARISIIAHLSIALVSLFSAFSLLSTADTPPYECFTQGGTYEDNVSGVEGFGYYILLVFVVSYIWALIDLLIWSARKLAHLLTRLRAAQAATQTNPG